jgi:hypothetical protein
MTTAYATAVADRQRRDTDAARNGHRGHRRHHSSGSTCAPANHKEKS